MIFMNTPCAARSIFFSLGGRSFKIYLLIINILLERGQTRVPYGREMLLKRHSDHNKGSWLMQKQKQLEKIGGEWLNAQKKMMLYPQIYSMHVDTNARAVNRI